MDRHNNLHIGSRVELPVSLDWLLDPNAPEPPMSSSRLLVSKIGRILGRIGVFTCALAVVATASILAMQIR
jgi:hypothetical protein